MAPCSGTQVTVLVLPSSGMGALATQPDHIQCHVIPATTEDRNCIYDILLVRLRMAAAWHISLLRVHVRAVSTHIEPEEIYIYITLLTGRVSQLHPTGPDRDNTAGTVRSDHMSIRTKRAQYSKAAEPRIQAGH